MSRPLPPLLLRGGGCLLLLLLLLPVGWAHGDWSYTNPTHWADVGACGGQFQSPINISTAAVTPARTVGHVTLFQPLGQSCEGCRAKKTGHGVEVLMDDCKVLLKADFLDGPYYLLQMHVHAHSEHLIDGRASDIELHIVFKHTTAAADYLVIAVLYRIGAPSPLLAPLVRQLGLLAGTGSAHLRDFRFSYHADRRAYYHYEGSLTTPPCTEGVTWLVQAEPWTVSAAQFRALAAAVQAQAGGHDNARPVQPLHGRQVTYREVRSCRTEVDGLTCLLRPPSPAPHPAEVYGRPALALLVGLAAGCLVASLLARRAPSAPSASLQRLI